LLFEKLKVVIAIVDYVPDAFFFHATKLSN